jgi:hypothetical protein
MPIEWWEEKAAEESLGWKLSIHPRLMELGAPDPDWGGMRPERRTWNWCRLPGYVCTVFF